MYKKVQKEIQALCIFVQEYMYRLDEYLIIIGREAEASGQKLCT
jgi:hypothetical protein